MSSRILLLSVPLFFLTASIAGSLQSCETTEPKVQSLGNTRTIKLGVPATLTAPFAAEYLWHSENSTAGAANVEDEIANNTTGHLGLSAEGRDDSQVIARAEGGEAFTVEEGGGRTQELLATVKLFIEYEASLIFEGDEHRVDSYITLKAGVGDTPDFVVDIAVEPLELAEPGEEVAQRQTVTHQSSLPLQAGKTYYARLAVETYLTTISSANKQSQGVSRASATLLTVEIVYANPSPKLTLSPALYLATLLFALPARRIRLRCRATHPR